MKYYWHFTIEIIDTNLMTNQTQVPSKAVLIKEQRTNRKREIIKIFNGSKIKPDSLEFTGYYSFTVSFNIGERTPFDAQAMGDKIMEDAIDPIIKSSNNELIRQDFKIIKGKFPVKKRY